MVKNLVNAVWTADENADIRTDPVIKILANAFSLGVDDAAVADRKARVEMATRCRPPFLLSEDLNIDEQIYTECLETLLYGTRPITKLARGQNEDQDEDAIDEIDPTSAEGGFDREGNALVPTVNTNSARKVWADAIKQFLLHIKQKGLFLSTKVNPNVEIFLLDANGGRRKKMASIDAAIQRLSADVVSFFVKLCTMTVATDDELNKFILNFMTGPFTGETNLDSTLNALDRTAAEILQDHADVDINTTTEIAVNAMELDAHDDDSAKRDKAASFAKSVEIIARKVQECDTADELQRKGAQRVDALLKDLQKEGVRKIMGTPTNDNVIRAAGRTAKSLTKGQAGNFMSGELKGAVDKITQSVTDTVEAASLTSGARTLKLSKNGTILLTASDDEDAGQDASKVFHSCPSRLGPGKKQFLDFPEVALTAAAIKKGVVSYDPPYLDLSSESVAEFFETKFLRHAANLIVKNNANLVRALSYCFRSSQDRRRYHDLFVSANLNAALLSMDYGNFCSVLIHAISIEFDTESPCTSEDFKQKFQQQDPQGHDESIPAFLGRIEAALVDWKGTLWAESHENKMKLVSKLVQLVRNKQIVQDLKSPPFYQYRGRVNNGDVKGLKDYMRRAYSIQMEDEKNDRVKSGKPVRRGAVNDNNSDTASASPDQSDNKKDGNSVISMNLDKKRATRKICAKLKQLFPSDNGGRNVIWKAAGNLAQSKDLEFILKNIETLAVPTLVDEYRKCKNDPNQENSSENADDQDDLGADSKSARLSKIKGKIVEMFPKEPNGLGSTIYKTAELMINHEKIDEFLQNMDDTSTCLAIYEAFTKAKTETTFGAGTENGTKALRISDDSKFHSEAESTDSDSSDSLNTNSDESSDHEQDYEYGKYISFRRVRNLSFSNG